MRDSHIQTYLCEQQKEIFIRNGVDPKKLIHNPVFKKKGDGKLEKIVIIAIPSDIDVGINRTNKEPIFYHEKICQWWDLTQQIFKKYIGWEVYISLHYNTKNWKDFINSFPPMATTEQIKNASVIIGLPPSFSTFLYQMSVEYPEKKIISFDVGNEMFGDYFQNYENIIYATDINMLNP